MRIKTVILYDIRRVQPETLDKLASARDGEMIGVERDEFNAITQLHLFETELKKVLRKDEAKRPRSRAEPEE